MGGEKQESYFYNHYVKTYSCNVDSDDESHDCAMATLYKDEVSYLVHILELVASYHEVLESLT